jgi:hypothetical protein
LGGIVVPLGRCDLVGRCDVRDDPCGAGADPVVSAAEAFMGIAAGEAAEPRPEEIVGNDPEAPSGVPDQSKSRVRRAMSPSP